MLSNFVICILVITAEISGFILIGYGWKRIKTTKIKFKLKHLWKEPSLTETSGVQLLIEGIFSILLGLGLGLGLGVGLA